MPNQSVTLRSSQDLGNFVRTFRVAQKMTQAEHSGASVESYFENLLPEAGIRELLKLKHQVTSTWAANGRSKCFV